MRDEFRIFLDNCSSFCLHGANYGIYHGGLANVTKKERVEEFLWQGRTEDEAANMYLNRQCQGTRLGVLPAGLTIEDLQLGAYMHSADDCVRVRLRFRVDSEHVVWAHITESTTTLPIVE